MKKMRVKRCLVVIMSLALMITSVLPGTAVWAAEVSEDTVLANEQDLSDEIILEEEFSEEEVQNTEDETLTAEAVEEDEETAEDKEFAEEIDPDTQTEEASEALEEETVDEGIEVQEITVQEDSEEPKEKTPSVIYSTFVAGSEWTANAADGASCGEKGSSQIEKIKVKLNNLEEKYEGSSVYYTIYQQSNGWLDEAVDWGLKGRGGKRLEAVKIRLSGPIADDYSIFYRTYVDGYGWLGWTKNGKAAGSSHYNKKMQSIQIKLVKKGEDEPSTDSASYKCPIINYRAYLKGNGWTSWVTNGKTAGSTNKSKRLEAFQVKLLDIEGLTGYSGGITYRANVSGSWQGWKEDGETAGTTGKMTSAIKVKLTGDVSKRYNVYYSVHIADLGWSGYARNGQPAGTVGLGKQIEGIRIKIVKKKTEGPTSSGKTFVESYLKSQFKYSGRTHEKGATAKKAQGKTLSAGKKKSLDGVTLYLTQKKSRADTPKGHIKYRIHLTKSGWTSWKTEGKYAGTKKSSEHADAIQIKLTGDLADYYDIYYRTKIENYGWMGWAKNDQIAGSTKIDYRLEALQIRLLPKGSDAPGKNEDYYTEKARNMGPDLAMYAKANTYSSATSYIVMVDRSAHRVGIYKGGKGFWENIAYWRCANGKPSTPSPAGVFSIGSKGYYFDSGRFRCFWYTQYYGNYLFHSYLCWPDGSVADGRLGQALSHGCIRLNMDNAKWMYDNIPYGTKVVIYN